MSWRSFDKPTHTTFEEGPLKDGALQDGLINLAKGDPPPVAIIKAIMPKGDMNMQHDWRVWVLNIAGAVVALIPQVSTALPPAVAPWAALVMTVGNLILHTVHVNAANDALA